MVSFEEKQYLVHPPKLNKISDSTRRPSTHQRLPEPLHSFFEMLTYSRFPYAVFKLSTHPSSFIDRGMGKLLLRARKRFSIRE